VPPAVYFNWLEEATIRAADAVGWPLERISSAGSVIIQYRHDAEFFEAAHAADEVEIISRLVDVRRVRGTWLHDLVRTADGTRLMRNYSTGVWLDTSGRISRAPAGMMEACVAGPQPSGRGG
jgi:acyl-CoA thioesterase FadM